MHAKERTPLLALASCRMPQTLHAHDISVTAHHLTSCPHRLPTFLHPQPHPWTFARARALSNQQKPTKYAASRTLALPQAVSMHKSAHNSTHKCTQLQEGQADWHMHTHRRELMHALNKNARTWLHEGQADGGGACHNSLLVRIADDLRRAHTHTHTHGTYTHGGRGDTALPGTMWACEYTGMRSRKRALLPAQLVARRC